MKKLLVPFLAIVTIFAVAFVLVELRAPLTPAASPTTAPPPLPTATPSAQPAPPNSQRSQHAQRAAFPPPSITTPPVAPSNDPLDTVVRGRTRREWHAYYAERQREIVADIQSYQSIVDRAIAGEEPDPRQLANAHDKIRELNARLKEDLEALQTIDANP